jgi:WD40 repeat protein
MDNNSNNQNQSFWKHYKTIIITVGVTLLLVVLILAALAFGMLKYYIDGASINRRAIDAPLRSVLWENPRLLQGHLNRVRNNRDASISSDGRMIVLAHEYSENNFDLYVSHCVDDEWSQQIPIDEINSPYNEKGPEISDDGQFLFFHSDRPGGSGGYDIWYSYREGNRWSRPVNMGNFINTATNERDPAISPDSKNFFFSSDRPVSNEDANQESPDYDLYMALAPKIDKKAKSKEIIPKPPEFRNPVNMVAINSPYDEGKAVLTPRGSTIYFSSNRPDGIGGYDLYRSYFVKGTFLDPINFGTPINSAFDEINPTMTLEGFGIYFSSNRKSRNPNDYHVFRSTSREVLMKFDYAMLVKMILSFLGILLGILLVYLLLKILLADTRMKLIWKCLLAAVIIHLVIIIMSAFWFLATDIADTLKPAPKEMTLNVNNLARESIAMAIRESVASLPAVQTTSVVEKLPIPTQKPVNNKSTPTQKSTVPKTSVTPVSMETVQDVSGEPPKGESLPTIKPFQAGASIKMESPPGEAAGIATPTAGKASDGIPEPFKKTPKSRDIPKIEMDTVPIEMTIVQIEDPNEEVLYKNNIAPPSIDRALKQANRVLDTPEGNDPTANEILLAASAVPVLNVPGSMGTLMFDTRLTMERGQLEKMAKVPELGLLLKDSDIVRALALTMQNDRIAEQQLKDLIEGYIKKNRLKFNSFEIVRFLIAENKLKPVGDLVYQNMAGLNIPADSELEVPEKYNK